MTAPHISILDPEVGGIVATNNTLAYLLSQTLVNNTMIEALDLTLNSNSDNYTSNLVEDYKAVRAEIKRLVFIKASANLSNWSALTIKEKEIAAKHFLVPKSLRLESFSNTELDDLAVKFHVSSTRDRDARASKAMGKVYNTLDISDAQIVVDDIELDNLFSKYKHYGREGTIEGDLEGLFDFLESRTGTKYDANGTTKGMKGRTMVGLTNTQVDQLTVDVMDIVKLGK